MWSRAEPSRAEPSRAEPSREAVAGERKYTVLVVEDVDEISANMGAALDKRGHRVKRASNAEDAIEMAENDRPAMILTDPELPTFEELMKLLRAHGTLKNMLVAIIDVNHLKISDKSVNILADFQALDDLLKSSQEQKH
jgi:DNA-binding NtrC family response regulator